jgi:hypothetical protein
LFLYHFKWVPQIDLISSQTKSTMK